MYLSLGCICYSTAIREIELDMRKNTHKRNATTKYLVRHDKRHKRIEQREGVEGGRKKRERGKKKEQEQARCMLCEKIKVQHQQ